MIVKAKKLITTVSEEPNVVIYQFTGLRSKLIKTKILLDEKFSAEVAHSTKVQLSGSRKQDNFSTFWADIQRITLFDYLLYEDRLFSWRTLDRNN